MIIQNLVDAACGRVTAALFPFTDFRKVWQIGQRKHNLTPLFYVPMLHHYYMLDAFITEDAIVTHVPFKSLDPVDAFRLVPFPILVNGSVLTLDLPSSVVLTFTDLS